MDADKILEEGCSASDLFFSCRNAEIRQASLIRMAQAFDSLDRWIRAGGALPRAWRVTEKTLERKR